MYFFYRSRNIKSASKCSVSPFCYKAGDLVTTINFLLAFFYHIATSGCNLRSGGAGESVMHPGSLILCGRHLGGGLPARTGHPAA